jgi:hypothetical protein
MMRRHGAELMEQAMAANGGSRIEWSGKGIQEASGGS